jgi:transglutaminase-like putative cysteine protease
VTAPTSEPAHALAWTSRPVAELTVAALSVVTVLTCWRLFEGWSFVPPLVAAALLSHGIGALTRRAGWAPFPSLLVSLAGLVMFVTLVQFRDTSFFGLPTHATWEAAQLQLRAAWEVFPTAIAPVPATGGFITATILLVWLLAHAADDFAHRAEAPIEAVVPSAVLFLVGTALGGDRHRVAAAALWLAAAALTVAVLRVERSEGAGWFGGTRRRAVGTAVRVGAGLAAAAVIIGVVAGPALPGASSDPLLDTRQGRASRTTLSPLVDIQGRLVNQSATELFTVISPKPAYWRMTALDDFDGRIWRSSRTYGDAGGTLEGGVPDGLGTPLKQTIQIDALNSVWLPAAFGPKTISIPSRVRYDSESASLLIRQTSTPTGLTYDVQSVIPNLDAAALARTASPVPAHILQHYLELPSDYPSVFRDLARQVVANAATPYDKALALQNWFRDNFTYDLNVPPGHSDSAIANFLSQRRGYCEQFAGTYAAFARSLGLPARVAVGFTPGTLGSDGLYHVDGKHAHAWPEVYFGGIGWVAFEPTPGRGEPGAQGYTGISPQQAGGAIETPTNEATAPGTTVPATPGGGTKIENGNQELIALPNLGDRLGSTKSASSDNASTLERLGLGLLVAAVLAVIALVVAAFLRERRWHRRWASAPSGPDRVLVTWQRTLDGLERAGLPVSPANTPREVAAQVAPTLSEPDSLEELAETATAAAYSDQPESADPARAESLRVTVQGAALRRLPIGRRLLWRLRPA